MTTDDEGARLEARLQAAFTEPSVGRLRPVILPTVALTDAEVLRRAVAILQRRGGRGRKAGQPPVAMRVMLAVFLTVAEELDRESGGMQP